MIVQKKNLSGKKKIKTINSERYSLFSNYSFESEKILKTNLRRQSSINIETKRRAMFKLSLVNHFNLKKTALTCVKIGLNNKDKYKKFNLQFHEICLLYKLLLFIRSLCLVLYSFMTISIFKILNLNENQEKFKNIIFFMVFFLFLFLYIFLIKKEVNNNFLLVIYFLSYFMLFISIDVILGYLISRFYNRKKYCILYLFI